MFFCLAGAAHSTGAAVVSHQPVVVTFGAAVVTFRQA